jgi:tetratricopeptide (TPR) repeat protein
MRRDLFDPGHPTMASTFYNIALTHHRDLARPDLAEPLYREAVDICRDGCAKQSLARYVRGWGAALADTGRYAEAERQLDRARTLYVELEAGVDVANTESEQAGVLASTGREKEAASLLRAALPALQAGYAPGHRVPRRAAERLKALEARGF